MAICESAGVFHVGDVVRKLRKDRNQSVEDLAKKAGIAKMTLSALERGASNYRRDTLDAIAAALDTTSDKIAAMAQTDAAAYTAARDALLRAEVMKTTPSRRGFYDTDDAQYAAHVLLSEIWNASAAMELTELLTMWGRLDDDDRELILETMRRFVPNEDHQAVETSEAGVPSDPVEAPPTPATPRRKAGA
jgi:transcriptional regulator with XRE-family HTH domain